ncbi:MAG: MetQ/NlpA family ABC transporter substrate-binding protein [Campylobacter sp.]|nr:MetQ/NlpA family ABC transporter substrate-binding protein [Campylobacter sp.]
MKKLLFSLTALVALTSGLFAQSIVVAATPVPHAEILEAVKGELKDRGYELEIKEFNDYVIPNLATDSGEVDANFFQHEPYLNEFNNNKGTKLVGVGSVHIEPMGVYSIKIKSLDELENGAKVSLPNDPTNESRALDILADAGLIELNDSKLKTPLDIIDNPKKLEFIEVEAASVPRTLQDVDIAVINTNYAMNAGFNPLNDSLKLESTESPYANIIVVNSGKEEDAKIKALVEALNSDTAKEFIKTKYNGAIIPTF